MKEIIDVLSNIPEENIREQVNYRRNGMDFIFRRSMIYQEIINLTKKTVRFYHPRRKTPYCGKLVNGTVIWSK